MPGAKRLTGPEWQFSTDDSALSRAVDSVVVRRHRQNGPNYELWGCDYCTEPQNHHLGHLDHCDQAGGVVLLRCPLCESIYEPGGPADDGFCRLSLDEAAKVLPLDEWRVIPSGR